MMADLVLAVPHFILRTGRRAGPRRNGHAALIVAQAGVLLVIPPLAGLMARGLRLVREP
jgi:uncharacterized membrane protein